MRMHLEPLSVQSTQGPTANVETGVPQEVEIEVAAIWVKVAGAKMYACTEILGPKGNPNWEANQGAPGKSGGTWDGVDGYHPDRWAHWKQIFSEVAQGNWRANVAEAAQASVLRMCDHDSLADTHLPSDCGCCYGAIPARFMTEGCECYVDHSCTI